VGVPCTRHGVGGPLQAWIQVLKNYNNFVKKNITFDAEWKKAGKVFILIKQYCINHHDVGVLHLVS
jgi:hypothetical protein